MIVAPGNRLNTAFLVRLMLVLLAICPRKVQNPIYKDKLEFTMLLGKVNEKIGNISHCMGNDADR